MSAQTVAQLEGILGEYVDPESPGFVRKLKQVLPRMYAMGTWRDTTEEISLDASIGYVTLPHDTDAVLACTANNYPRPVRSMWHDVRIVGRTAQVNSAFGAVDAGFHPVMLDMKDVQGVAVADIVPTDTLHLVKTGTDDYPAGFTGSVTIVTDAATNGGVQTTAVVDATTVFRFVAADTFTRIKTITYADVTVALDIVDPDFPEKVIATVPPGSGVLRFRRFRANSNASCIHFLIKKACPSYLAAGTVVELANIGAIKHALLGLIAEDNGDTGRAGYHWGWCGKLLDEELATITGAAKPTLMFGDAAASPIHSLYG